MPDQISLRGGALVIAGATVLAGVGAQLTLVEDALGHGTFVRLTAEQPAARQVFAVGTMPALARFTACHRYEPFWMKPTAGTAARQVPPLTQSLLVELADGRCALLVPLIDAPFYASLEGDAEDRLLLVAESDDTTAQARGLLGLFVAVGDDPYELVRRGARSVVARLKSCRLRVDKPLPAFIDRFGWCTWDAFYHEVSDEKVRLGLESFKAGGVQPRLLILDDGWQSERATDSGERRLTAFAANAKFPGDLAPTVAMAKSGFGIETFMVWHAFQGYWGGIDPAAFPRYRVLEQGRRFSPGVKQYWPIADEKWWGHAVGLVAPDSIHRFYQDYHRHLREQGVDGVKVDNQSCNEALSQGQGGRIGLMRAYHEALEGSVHTQLQGNLINCMSCSTDVIYQTLNSTILRTSTDFWPNKPESHGLHLYTNAQVCLWFGEFVHGDWDMFQSAHPMGPYHAAARAVGGCPVYVSDKPDAHDFALLRKMVLSDGSVLRCADPGLPTRDCLFRNPLVEEVLLKIFNRALRAGLVGAFNARYHESAAERTAIAGRVGPLDVPGLAGREFAIYAHRTGTLARVERAGTVPVELAELDYELFTIVPVEDGIAAIGLADKFNSAGAITAKGPDPRGGYAVALRDGGRFLAWCASRPRQVLAGGVAVEAAYDARTGALVVELAGAGPQELRIVMA
jgi:raffinose synthase